jgi:hypothetical protein
MRERIIIRSFPLTAEVIAPSGKPTTCAAPVRASRVSKLIEAAPPPPQSAVRPAPSRSSRRGRCRARQSLPPAKGGGGQLGSWGAGVPGCEGARRGCWVLGARVQRTTMGWVGWSASSRAASGTQRPFTHTLANPWALASVQTCPPAGWLIVSAAAARGGHGAAKAHGCAGARA